MLSTHDRLALIHAVFASLAGLILIPAAVVIGRLYRHDPHWFRYHVCLNAAGVVMIVIAFGLGTASVASQDEGAQFSGDESDLHHKLGLAVFLLVCVQTILGVVGHYFGRRSKVALVDAGDHSSNVSSSQHHDKKTVQAADTSVNVPRPWRQRSPTQWLHIGLGISTVALLYWCIWDGMHTEWQSMSTSGSVTPRSVQILFWVLLLGPLLAYLGHAGTDILSTLERLTTRAG